MKLIVGIGASAGGLKALESFFKKMPPTSGCCFVVVQHLSPDFKSLLGDLLARHTTMTVQFVEHGMATAPNTIFLIPPGKLLTLHAGHFQLSERDITTVAELPIDVFFCSLADDAGFRSVGVVLSGGGSDGSAGVRAIREAGGLVLVQRPDTAEFESMPLNALSATIADQALAPEEMGAVILAHARDPAESGSRHPFANPADLSLAEGEPLARIITLLQRTSGIDFSQYKVGTVERRIERRKDLKKLSDLGAYADLLAADPDELNSLYGDMLIGVTEFFRDADAFAVLREKIAPHLAAADRQDEVRIWVMACATGEEAYSLAILFDEVARKTGFNGRFSMFATDVHSQSLDFAAAGIYTEERLKNISPERLARYFREEKPGYYRIIPEIRKRLVFAPHNLVNDPPFTKLDLVSCRNLLIYFGPAMQERAIRLFHFSLRDGGYLFLGPSEGVGRLEGVNFEAMDARLKFFKKTGGSPVMLPRFRPQPGPRPSPQPIPPAYALAAGTLRNRQLLAAYDHILNRHAPPGLLINDTFEILHYFGPASRYLAPLQGRAHENILTRIDGDLRLALSTLLPRVFKTGKAATSRNVRVSSPTGEERLDVVADPISESRGPVSMAHVSFVNARPLPPSATAATAEQQADFIAGEELLNRIQDLEIELQSTKENLQTAVEELQASNEELQAGNEELTASNEELQSTNEELHAANEELYTLNTEFERKNTDLQLLNDDLNNLSNSTETGTVFVDRDLRIRKFNPAIERIFRLRPQDIGRPIDHIAYHLDGQEQMIEDIRSVLAHGKLIQKEVRTHEGHWLLKRILPFLTVKGTTDGVVLTFTDIDETKAMQMRLNLAMASSRLIWWDWQLLTDRFQVHCAQACYMGYTAANLPVTGAAWHEATHPEDIQSVRAAIQQCLDGSVNEWTSEHRLRMADGSWRWVLNSGKVTERDTRDRPVRMLGTTQDIQTRHSAEETVHRDAELLSKIKEAIICTDSGSIVTYWNEGATALFGWSSAEMIGKPYYERFPPGEEREQARLRQQAFPPGDHYRERHDYRKDGSRVWTAARFVRFNDTQDRPAGFIGLFYDITERRTQEETLRRDAELLSKVKDSIVCTDLEGIVTYWNDGATTLYGWTSDEMLGRSIFECVPAELRGLAHDKFAELLKGTDFKGEKEDWRKDGSVVSVDIQASALSDATGQPIGTISLSHDITDRKRAEQERRELEHQLFQAQKMETMGTLAGGIAHDFNNIIATIIGYTQLALTQNEPDERTRRYHDGVLKAAFRARDLVKRILSFSRFHEPERTSIQLDEVITEAAKFIRSTLPSTVELSLDLDPKCPRTLADSNQLHQVLLNLATNAAHAMRDQGGRISISLRMVNCPAPRSATLGSILSGSFLALEVADTGHGIDAEILKKIFDPFFTTKPVGEGTGLGLSIVHGIIEGHGGGLDVASTVGVGTVFTIYLPVVPPENGASTPSNSTPFPFPRGHGEPVAVIDDEDDVAQVTQAVLKQIGYDARRFSSADEFYAEFATMHSAFKIIVTDHTMPRVTGLQLARKLRAAGHTLPILIVSGYSREITPEALASIGRSELLTKPCNMEQLATTVRNLLQESTSP